MTPPLITKRLKGDFMLGQILTIGFIFQIGKLSGLAPVQEK